MGRLRISCTLSYPICIVFHPSSGGFHQRKAHLQAWIAQNWKDPLSKKPRRFNECWDGASKSVSLMPRSTEWWIISSSGHPGTWVLDNPGLPTELHQRYIHIWQCGVLCAKVRIAEPTRPRRGKLRGECSSHQMPWVLSTKHVESTFGTW